MNDQRTQNFLLIALGLAALLLASSLLVAVVNLGTQIASFWLLLIVQIAIAILAVGFVLGIIGKIFTWVVSEIALLHERHKELLRALKKRTPWFVVLTLLVSQAVLVIADKSFQGQELPTVAVTLVLILLFFLANEFIVREHLMFRVLGFVLWFAAVLALPFFVWADRGFDTSAVLTQIDSFPMFYKAFYVLCSLVFILMPLLFIQQRDA